jgi:hypothetical protein
MDWMRVLRPAAAGALAMCAVALAPGAARARIAARVDSAAAAPAVVHKGAKLFQYCTTANGCWTAMFVYSQGKEFEVPEASIFGGTYTTEKVGKKRYTVFTSDIESGAQCKLTGLKSNKGYSSQADPGSIVCKEGSAPPYIEEAWWAVKV